MAGRKRRRRGEGSVSYRKTERRWRGTLYVAGVPSYVYGRTEEEAVTALDALRARAKQPDPILRAAVPLAVYLDDWLATVRPHLAPGTASAYAAIIRLYLTPALGKVRLDRLTPAQIQRLVGELAAGYAPSRVRTIGRVLSAALTHAVRLRLIPENPVRFVVLPPVRKARIRPPTRDQVRALLRACAGERYGPVVVVLVATGLRVGEVLGLCWEDLHGGWLTVRRQVYRHGGQWIVAPPKSEEGARTIALPALALEALAAQRTQQDTWRSASTWTASAWDLVFTTPHGAPLHRTAFWRWFQGLCTRAGVPAMRVHDLRHAAASLMIAGGASLKEVSATLGHANIRVTGDIYAHLYSEGQRELARRMDAMLAPDGPKSGPGSGPNERAKRGQLARLRARRKAAS